MREYPQTRAAQTVGSRTSRPTVTFLSPIRRAWAQRALVAALVRRELVARYRGGALGFLWSLLNPLLLLLVYATVFRFVFAPRADVRPYALFLFGGVLVWGFVSAALIDAVGDLPRQRSAAAQDDGRAGGLSGGRRSGRGSRTCSSRFPVLGGGDRRRRGAGSVRRARPLSQFPVVLALLVARGLRAALGRLGAVGALRRRARPRRATS